MFVPKCMPTPSDQAAAEVRAGLYALLAAAWRYPDSLLVSRLRQSGVLDFNVGTLECAAVQTAMSELHRMQSGIRHRTESSVLRELGGAHVRLFGHAVRGTCPPYELEYGRGEIIQQTADLADLAGFYSAFGLELDETACERADHVAVELEFMCVLCSKEAWGCKHGEPELAERCSDARRLFLRDHLARWLPAFAHRVAALDQDGFYGRAASLAAALIVEECRMFDIEAGPQWLELRPADPQRDTEIDCESSGCGGAGDEKLVQIGMENSVGNAT